MVVVEEDGFDWGAKFAQEVRVLVDRKVLLTLSHFQTSALQQAENVIDRFRARCLGNAGGGLWIMSR